MWFFVFCFLLSGALARLALNSLECFIYIDKLYKLKVPDPKIIQEENKITISLFYYDQLFNNETFWGLTPDDGKEADSTCLDQKIEFYTSDTFQELLTTDKPNLTHSTDSTTQERYLSFILDPMHQAVRSSSQYYNFFKVYIAQKYKGAGSSSIIKSNFMQLSLRFNRYIGQAIKTRFFPIPQLLFCNILTCNQTYSTQPVVLGQNIILQQKNIGFSYKTIITKIYLIGKGLNKEINPHSLNYAIAGQVIIQMTFDIVWNDCQIQVESFLSNSTEILTPSEIEKQGKKIVTTLDIECIKINSNSTGCPTCSDECLINKEIVESECSQCKK